MMSVVLLAMAVGATQGASGVPEGTISLTAQSGPGGEMRCSAMDGAVGGRWCVSMAQAALSPLVLTHDGKQVGRWTPPEGDETFEVVPAVLPLEGGSALVIARSTRQVMYSGGGGRIITQHVILVEQGGQGTATRVLSLPAVSGLMIRACFAETDIVKRAGACHDTYSMFGFLSFGRPSGEMPVIRFKAEASSYPRGVSRDKDSLARPPLRKADLVWDPDRACTYTRAFHFDPVEMRYLPDAPLPDCSQYLDD
ncbi:hypothetical protein SAMN05192583_2910 [Sphingomonas gellani]|uniref:Uncharacterized protein n=1 Tax=Sphingomonas gellani TaxID=1166340 RepID=A0A1H8GVJ3_9SPHN|nr:hypothetical protein [Sphingomonas gellani]SEN48023.1 hypothetical protein SAMN05192583_2910 [Sphingomonas gellani]